MPGCRARRCSTAIESACAGGQSAAAVSRPAGQVDADQAPPYLTEGWYCCAEPGPEQLETLCQ